MRTTLTFILASITTLLFATDRYFFDLEKLGSDMVLVGTCPGYDNENVHNNLSFQIKDSVKIREFVSTLKLGKEAIGVSGVPTLQLHMVQNFTPQYILTIYPDLGLASNDYGTFTFDVDLMKSMIKGHLINCLKKHKIFPDTNALNSFIEKQKTDSNFLFHASRIPTREGTFEIQFPRTSQFSSPKAISQYLETKIEGISSKGSYSVTYILTPENLSNQNQFTMTITGSKKLFDELKIPNLSNKDWKPNEIRGTYFYLEN